MAKKPKTSSRTIDIHDTAAIEVLADPMNGGLFEIVRRFRSPATAAQIAAATGLSHATVMARMDALVSVGLVESLRPRAPRKVYAYGAACRPRRRATSSRCCGGHRRMRSMAPPARRGTGPA